MIEITCATNCGYYTLTLFGFTIFGLISGWILKGLYLKNQIKVKK